MKLIISLLVPLLLTSLFLYFRLPYNRLVKYHTNFNKKLINNLTKNEEYDFIIVGGGTAGTVVASRLSETLPNKETYSVLLLESGPADDVLTYQIPGLFWSSLNTSYFYNYNTVPQKGMNNTELYIPRGKILGGCSSINAGVYLRASAYDYDEWEGMGNKGWKFDDVLKYFKKSEKYVRGGTFDKNFHSNEGEWVVNEYKNRHPLTDPISKAFQEEMNLPFIEDINGAKFQREGISHIQHTSYKGKRFGVTDAFLTENVLKRVNLFVRTGVSVNRILFREKQNEKIAYGVETIDESGIKEIIHAKKEVILSAGTYSSPHILMLSGIGDKEVLTKHSIPVVHHNTEVGQNLQDHPGVELIHEIEEPISFEKNLEFPYNYFKIMEWIIKGENELTNTMELAAYFRTDIAKKNNETAPDIQILVLPAVLDGAKKPGDYGYSLGVMVALPKGTGSLSIKSKNIFDDPVIDHKIHENEDDFNRLAEGVMMMTKMVEGKTLSAINHKTKGYYHLNKPVTFDQIHNHLRKNSFMLYHPTSTCSMGKVVDERLKVYGVKGLRVIDASVMPKIPRSNTMAPTVMVAEKGAAMILEDYK